MFKWLNEHSRIFLQRGYLQGDTTPEERIRQIADAFGEYIGDAAKGDKFYEYMSRGYYSLASPVWANYGLERGLPVSCFSSVPDDCMTSIMDTVAETGMLMKSGGGTAGYFGELRPRGAAISTGGESSGSVHFMRLFDSLADIVSQSNVRRGFFTPYLDATHGDILEFLDIGIEGNPIQGMTTGVVCSDEFMQDVEEGNGDARKVWAKILQRRSEVGYPYIMFGGNANSARPEVYKDNGLEIKASNMCVAPETRIVTDKGYVAISDVAGTKQNVWNGEEWSEVEIVKTGENQKLLSVCVGSLISKGDESELECTEYHKWFLEDGTEVTTKDLKVGDKLLPWKNTDGKTVKDTIINIRDDGRYDDTYCFTEPKRHMGVFNGILTGQCNEIMLPSSPEETFVCVLSSMNILHYDEWKDNDAVEILTQFLDTVVTEFVEKGAKIKYLERPVRFAERHRALGLGVLGWHSYLQSHNIAFESREAAKLNLEIAKLLKQKTYRASEELAKQFGEPELLKGYGRRNTTTMAIAPTKSSSFILGQVSQSIEPEFGNVYVKDLAKIKTTIYNPYLKARLGELGMDNADVWQSIIEHDGSVQHLDFLSEHDKNVYKTFAEINPETIIDQAAVRQEYIDQGMSLNLMIRPSMPVKDINALIFRAYKLGLKGLYYQYALNAAQELTRSKMREPQECVACGG